MFMKTYAVFFSNAYISYPRPYSQLHNLLKPVNIVFLSLHSVRITGNLSFFAWLMSEGTKPPCNKGSLVIAQLPYSSQLVVTLQKLYLKKSHFIKYCQKTKEQKTAEKKNGHHDIYC